MGDGQIEVKLEDETVWLTQDQMADLFQKAKVQPGRSKKIADNALVALTLMIAESKPEEKDMMIKVVVNLINLKN